MFSVKNSEAYEWCVENQDVSESFFVQVNSIHICLTQIGLTEKFHHHWGTTHHAWFH